MIRLLATGALLGAMLAATPAPAQTADSAAARLKQMMECDAIKTESMRLSCYDQAVRRSRAALGGGRVGMLPGLSAAAPVRPEEQFGMNAKLEKQQPDFVEKPQGLSEITARITSARDNGIGMWRFAFADGSSWASTESVSQFDPPRAGQEVRIRKGVMGAYLMIVGQQPSFHVERLR